MDTRALDGLVRAYDCRSKQPQRHSNADTFAQVWPWLLGCLLRVEAV